MLRYIHSDVDQEVLLGGNIPPVDPVLFEPITEQLISKAVLELQGSHGPSGGDAAHWKRLTLSFGCKSKRLREAMAKFARRMCTERMDPEVLEAFLANRLVAIDKCPGVRPVGIGEAPRRIIGKGIVKVLKKDIQMAAGSYNLCAGQAVGIEALIHAMIEAFELMSTEAAFLADASNAFNRLNRKVALWNIQYICPPLTIVLYNTYRHPTRMFVLGGFELSSKEGTTQGCPLAMAMYALGVIPLIKECQGKLEDLDDFQGWLADDSQIVGKLESIRKWWDTLCENGPKYGYFPNARKSYLVVKPKFMDRAKQLFKDTEVKIANSA